MSDTNFGLCTLVAGLSLAAGIYGFILHSGNLRWGSLGSRCSPPSC